MKFCVNTVYNRKNLVAFNDFFAKTKIWLFIIMAIGTVIVTSTFIMSLALNFCNLTFIVCFALLWFIDAVSVYTYFILPRTSIKKAPALGATVHFEFCDVNYTVTAKSDKVDETATACYSTILKVYETKSFIYAFISKAQAYIIDKNGFTEGTPDGLVDFLVSKNIKYKKFS